MMATRWTDMFLAALDSLPGGMGTPEQVAKRMGFDGSIGSLKMLGHIASDLVAEGRIKRHTHCCFYESCGRVKEVP